MDKIDKHILNILQIDGRIRNAELAKRVGLSQGACLERVKKLENRGIISSYQAILNAEKIGIGIESFVQITLSRHKQDALNEFMEVVQNVPEIIECYYITGGADFLLKIAVENIKAYQNFLLNKLSTLPNLQHVETMMVMSNTKQSAPYQIK